MMESALTRSMDFDLWEELENCTNLPSPPVVAGQLLDLAQAESTDFNDVAETVSLDPAIAAKILRLANSSFYKRQKSTESITQAISLFGISGILSIALTFSLVKIPKKHSTGLNLNEFWLRSLACAVICRKLSVLCSAGAKEQFYLAGLLQDIGMLAINTIRPDIYEATIENTDFHTNAIQLERAELGVDHAEIGSWLLQRWSFASQYPEATLNSHLLDSPTSSSEDNLSILASVVALSSSLASVWNMPASDAVEEIEIAELPGIDVTKEALTTLLEKAKVEINEIAPAFDLTVPDEATANEYLSKSRDILLERTLQTEQKLGVTNQQLAHLERKSESLQQKLDFDELTEVHSRSYFYKTVQTYFNRSLELCSPLAIVFVDIDNFKVLNDTHGHSVGDSILKSVADRLRIAAQTDHIVARVGGEEFIVLMPETGFVTASQVCDRLIRSSELPCRIDNELTISSITVSAGLAVHGEDRTYSDYFKIIEDADEACYQSKNSGKNKWTHAIDPALSNKSRSTPTTSLDQKPSSGNRFEFLKKAASS